MRLQVRQVCSGWQTLPLHWGICKPTKTRLRHSPPPSKRYLDKVHMDIVYGDSISKLGFPFALLLIDRATKYIWV